MDEGDTRSAVGLWRGEPAQPLIHHPVWRQVSLSLSLSLRLRLSRSRSLSLSRCPSSSLSLGLAVRLSF